MNDTPDTDLPEAGKTETAGEALKRVLAAKKAKTAPSHGSAIGAKAEERAVAARSAALAKPAFRKASKRG